MDRVHRTLKGNLSYLTPDDADLEIIQALATPWLTPRLRWTRHTVTMDLIWRADGHCYASYTLNL